MIFKNSSKELAQNYDYFILDVWGVIHDGIEAYPNVVDNLKYLRSLGKKICFLSNAPRRSGKVAEVLSSFGIDKSLYDFILTSGEATYLFLEENKDYKTLSQALKTSLKYSNNSYNYYYIGPEKDEDLLNGLGYNATLDASKADFVVTTGFDNEFSTINEKLPQLKEAIEHNLTMICVNPDLIVIRQSGHELLCAGVLANEYQKMGGKVVYFGKPYDMVYKQVFRLFGNPNKNRVLAIGDGIETDILGANNQGIDSALIAGGILSNTLKVKYGQLPDANKMKQFCNQNKIYPKLILAGL